jgi:pyruvate,orthophosphate dikinase
MIEIFRTMGPCPVAIRLLDPPLHEFLPAPSQEVEVRKLAERLGMDVEKVRRRVQGLSEKNPMYAICQLAICAGMHERG